MIRLWEHRYSVHSVPDATTLTDREEKDLIFTRGEFRHGSADSDLFSTISLGRSNNEMPHFTLPEKNKFGNLLLLSVHSIVLLSSFLEILYREREATGKSQTAPSAI